MAENCPLDLAMWRVETVVTETSGESSGSQELGHFIQRCKWEAEFTGPIAVDRTAFCKPEPA